MALPYLDAEAVTAATPWPALIDALRDAFRGDGHSPVRHHHTVPGAEAEEHVTLLLMPAWNPGGSFGIKVAAVAPANASVGLPTLHGVYLLFEQGTGVPRAVLDAGALTARRTAAASALAARYLAREDAQTLLVIGTGRVAHALAAAHCAVRPIREVRVWGRRAARAEAMVESLSGEGIAPRCVCVPDVRTGAQGADIITSATSARAPLLAGEWVAPGTHVDLVGAFTPAMCEADPALIEKADQVYIDTFEGAQDEAGDLLQAVGAGVFSFDAVAGDLYRLCAHTASARRDGREITLYKSVGAALQDLAAAELCLAT